MANTNTTNQWVTATTITDAQIRTLMADCESLGVGPGTVYSTCCRALGLRRGNIDKARARCAEIFNGREVDCDECDGTGENPDLDHPEDKQCLECMGSGRVAL